VVVSAGELVEDAVAIEGNVIVKAGATVKSAMALHGSVTVEDGATVRGSVIVLGGQARVAKSAKVGESQIVLDHSSLRVVEHDGHAVELSASFAGQSLAQAILQPILAKLHGCVVETRDR
jgi:UDP-3-O-[3-hydroxymyristoyl] glucosamine N-acyltransferase